MMFNNRLLLQNYTYYLKSKPIYLSKNRTSLFALWLPELLFGKIPSHVSSVPGFPTAHQFYQAVALESVFFSVEASLG